MTIFIDNISKRFGDFQALAPTSLRIEKGEMVGLLGPSGSGKTTLLRLIAGLEVADGGRILFDEEDITHKAVRERRVGFVFQNYALFRHMTVLENVGFGLRMLPRKERPSKASIRRTARQLLAMVQLEHLADRYPDQLSGGQRQRVALARALALEPQVLLLDEPFGALDAKVRQELRVWLKELHQELGFTSVFVTHDQEEALELSDRVVVMSAGRIEQVDTPTELFAHPNNRFVFDFLGEHVVFTGTRKTGVYANNEAWVALPNETEHQVELYLRSHEVALAEQPNETANFPMVVLESTQVGAQARVSLAPIGWHSDDHWLINISHEQARKLGLHSGQVLYVLPQRGHVFAGAAANPQFVEFTALPVAQSVG